MSRAALTATGLGAVLALLAASTARADRPALVDAESLAGAAVRVHFTRTGADAVPTADDDGNGIPDVVQAVATHADAALAAYAELGLRPPLADDGLADDGGDGRIDFYLMDLEDADGMFAADTCTAQPTHCTGHLIIENDFVGFGYPSVELAIKTLTSHELFHAVQAAYDADQPVAWSEGTAVWAEELVFPEQDDFEHLVAAFLERPARPFERGGGGFGDAYPYGAALWPYFLEQRFGVELLVAIWDALEDTGDDPEFLDATEALLPEFGVTLDEAWIEFTRWNAETGSYAAPGHYPEAARLAEATRESVHVGLGTVTTSIEGLSARYLALLVEEDAEITVTAARGVAASVRLADGPTGAELVIDAAESTDEFAVAEAHTVVARPRCDGAPCAVTLELVLSGVTPLTLPADVEVVVRAAPPPAADDDVGGGCCQASGPGDGAAGGTLALLVSALIGAPRRRRRAPRAAQPW